MTITSVPLLGVGMAIVVNAGTGAVLSFLIGWLALSEELKYHTIGGGAPFLAAPFYLAGILVGMVGLVFAPRAPLHRIACLKRCAGAAGAAEANADFSAQYGDVDVEDRDSSSSRGRNADGSRSDAESDGWQNGLETDSQKTRRLRDVALSEGRTPLSGGGAAATTPALSSAQLLRNMSIGVAAALTAGVFSSIQFGAVRSPRVRDSPPRCKRPLRPLPISAGGNVRNSPLARPIPRLPSPPPPAWSQVSLGKRYEEQKAGCFGETAPPCSARMVERFDNFGSWMASFGVGAAMVTSVFAFLYISYAFVRYRHLPSFHFRVLKLPGSVAGICWSLGAFFQTAAVVSGGNAVMMPANLSIQIITSGAWGILYYKEMPSKLHGVLWCIAAVWTLLSIILLGGEKK